MIEAGAIRESNVVPFRKRDTLANRLTAQDRVEALAWESGIVGGEYLVLHGQQPGEDPDIGDFISVYPGDSRWASWGIARRGRSVLLWRCSTGADIGEFDSVREALRHIPLATGGSKAFG